MKRHRQNKTDAYARAGVDVDVEAEASRIMYEASKKTFTNRRGLLGNIVTPFDDFAALKMVAVGNLPRDTYFSVGFDSAGTKVDIAHRTGVHHTIAFDLMAMVCDDALVRGGEPVLVGTTLDLKTLGTDRRFLPVVKDLARGYVAAAREAKVAVINGEIAQMGSLMGGWGDFPYHWGAAAVWFARKPKLFTGLEIRVGDAVVLVREHGFRANGLSLVRRIFQKKYGDQWHRKAFSRSTLGRAVLTPSIIYSRAVVALHGGFDTPGTANIHAVAHITGGGLPEKIGRVLRRSGLGVHLHTVFQPPAITTFCQTLGGVSDRDAYRAWNMGQGLAIITPEPAKVIAGLKKYHHQAIVAGEVVKKDSITVVSRGAEHPGKELVF